MGMRTLGGGTPPQAHPVSLDAQTSPDFNKRILLSQIKDASLKSIFFGLLCTYYRAWVHRNRFCFSKRAVFKRNSQ